MWFVVNKKLRVSIAATIPVLAVLLLVGFVERPFLRASDPSGREQRAAVAIRDDVIAFQKWGSRAFSEPYLDRYYGSVVYLTQTDPYDKRTEFQAAIVAAAANHEHVDLFLLAHSNRFINWVRDLPLETRSKLRLVYNTGCDDATQGINWLSVGARAYVAHKGVSMSPVFYVYFLRRWTMGASVSDSMANSNELSNRFIGYGSLLGVSGGKIQATKDGTEAVCFGDAGIRIDR